LGLVLRGIFLCRDRDIRWFYQEGASALFPDLWERFLAPIPGDERDDLVGAYYRRLTGEDEVARMAAAKAWSLWEAGTATLAGNPPLMQHFAEPSVALALARIECHYFVHGAFLEPDQLLECAGRLREIPGTIVHGRYDVICPMEQAWALSRAWPEAELRIVPEAGHAASEPGTREALVAATDALADRYGA
jgi:proline iminopeptidase